MALGLDSVRLSRVGLGAYAIGGPWAFGWGAVSDDESVQAIRHAVERGVNWIDTAPVYGLGHSEEVVGRAVRGLRTGEDVLIFTKCGRSWYGRPDGVVENDLQPPLSLLARGTLRTVIPWAHRHGTDVIVYSPMAAGLLTGRFSERIGSLDSDDWRRTSPAFAEPQLSRGLDLVERLRPLAARLGAPMPALAVAWTLAQPGVTGAIVGARRPDQIDGWAQAPALDLDAGALADIDRAIAASQAGTDEPPAPPARMVGAHAQPK